MAISDIINRMIEVVLTGSKITSASPGHVNTVATFGEFDHPDLETEIRTIIEDEIKLTEVEAVKSPDPISGNDGSVGLKKEVNSLTENLKNLRESPFGTLTSLTRSQTSILQSFSKDPFKFLLTKFFNKFAKGAGILLLATAIFAAVQLIISELMKPGRFLDRRFKRVARDEILLFNSTEVQAELRQGFRTVTITTMQFLKGAELRGQISGNLYNPSAIPMNRLDPRRTIPLIVSTQISSRASRFSNRRNSR